MIYDGIATWLRADIGLSALIGDRVYFLDAAASTTYPDVIQYPAAGQAAETLEGSGPPWTRRISIQCRGKTYAQAHAVGEEVLRILNNRVGVVSGENIQACRVVSDLPLIEDVSAVKRRVLDFRVTHAPA